MKRRGFLKFLAATPVAAALPALPAPKPIPADPVADMALELHTHGQAWSHCSYDPATNEFTVKRISAEQWHKHLEPGVRRVFSEKYVSPDGIEWTKLYD